MSVCRVANLLCVACRMANLLSAGGAGYRCTAPLLNFRGLYINFRRFCIVILDIETASSFWSMPNGSVSLPHGSVSALDIAFIDFPQVGLRDGDQGFEPQLLPIFKVEVD